MGYICPDCGEGLPEDTPCPCTMAGGDFIDEDDRAMIRGPLTAEIVSIRSPVRQFLGERFTSGRRDLQRRYREAAPSLTVPGVDRANAVPGTVGTGRRLAPAVPRATWGLGAVLDELAGHGVSLPAVRDEFQRLLLASQGPGR
jgi:hypothetical protein